MRKEPSEFEKAQEFFFSDKALLQVAFTHSSYLNESTGGEVREDNERLEFLGDAILSFVVSEMLYTQFPDLSEGELTSIRAALVRRESLARFARKLHLGDYLRLGHGEEESGGRKRPAILCATFEAIIGALYLDQGTAAVHQLVMPLVKSDLHAIKRRALDKDPKSRLQEWSQSEFGVPPRYRVLASVGPDHAKVFSIQVSIHSIRCGVGRGYSKQEASQAAAAMALHNLVGDGEEYEVDAELDKEWPVSDKLLDDLQNAATTT